MAEKWRNLQEQVLWNKQKIEEHYNIDRVLADFGIKVIGQVATEEDIPEGTYNYGDAYAVGTEAPYSFYVWTRASGEHTVDYFLNIGQLAIVGPQGPQGEQGETGPQGENTRWYVATYGPTSTDGFKKGDCWLVTNGDVYILDSYYYTTSWQLRGNIRGAEGPTGPQGPQGPQGEAGPQGAQGPQGDPGGFIHIIGHLDSATELPNPTILQDLTAAYLIGSNDLLYMQIGESYIGAVWTNLGQLNVATYVTSDGQYVSIWDADSKLDKITTTGTYDYRVYAVTNNGGQGFLNVSLNGNANTLVRRTSTGTMKSATPTGIDGAEVATVKYIQDNFLEKKTSTASYQRLYGIDASGNQKMFNVSSSSIGASTVPFRGTGGVLKVGTPVDDSDAATKKYVDDAIAALRTELGI